MGWGWEKVVVGVRLTFPAAAKSMPKTSLSPRGCYRKKGYEMRAGMVVVLRKTYFSRSSKVDAKDVPGTATQHVEVAHTVPQNIGLARQGDPLSVGDVLREVQVTVTPTE